jgi:hypothetical protein
MCKIDTYPILLRPSLCKLFLAQRFKRRRKAKKILVLHRKIELGLDLFRGVIT